MLLHDIQLRPEQPDKKYVIEFEGNQQECEVAGERNHHELGGHSQHLFQAQGPGQLLENYEVV